MENLAASHSEARKACLAVDFRTVRTAAYPVEGSRAAFLVVESLVASLDLLVLAGSLEAWVAFLFFC